MSDKIIGCRYVSEIDGFVRQGKSSRFISKWLAERGITISHVTIAQYMKSGISIEDFSSPLPESEPRVVIDEADLAKDLLGRVIESRNNPVALKTYLDAYLRMAERTQMYSEKPGVQSNIDLCKDIAATRIGKPTPTIKHLVYWLLSAHHPYWNSKHSEMTPEISADYRRWRNVLTATLEPLFQGRDPLESAPLVKR